MAAEFMKNIPLVERPFGYIFVDTSRAESHGFEVVEVEIHLRFDNLFCTLTCQVSDIDRENRTYGLFVSEDDCAERLIMFSDISYVDGSGKTIDHSTTIVDERFKATDDFIIPFLHVLIYSYAIADAAPLMEDGVTKHTAWYRNLGQEQIEDIKSNCRMPLRGMVTIVCNSLR